MCRSAPPPVRSPGLSSPGRPRRAATSRSLPLTPRLSTRPTMLRAPLLLLLLALCVPAPYAFPDGAPAEACLRGMEPNHSGTKGRNPLDSPFAVLRHTSHGRVTGEGGMENT